MKKYVLIAVFLGFTSMVLAAAPTLESLKASLNEKTQEMKDLQKNLNEVEAKKTQILEYGLTLSGEIRGLNSLIADFDKPVEVVVDSDIHADMDKSNG